MNSSEITRAKPELVLLKETLRSEEAPAVGQVKPSEPGDGDVSDETKSGFFRLAEFLKLENVKKKERDPKRKRGYQAYESARDFRDRSAPGQILSRNA